MRAQTILWLLLRSRKTDLLLVVGEPRDYHAGETGSREGSWKRRRLYTFQLFDHTRFATSQMPVYGPRDEALKGYRITSACRLSGSCLSRGKHPERTSVPRSHG